MSRRDEEKKRSLDALSKFAFSPGAPSPAPAKPPAPNPARRATPKPLPAAAPQSRGDIASTRARAKQMEERRMKLEEEKANKARRSNELERSTNLQWRGGGFTDIPASIRRTGFDVVEPSTAQKIHDVLGDVREKEGRAKAKDKGKRQGGR